MSRYPMTDPITIPPFPQNEKEVLRGLLFSFYVTGAADSNTQGSPSTFRSLSKGERTPPYVPSVILFDGISANGKSNKE